MPQVTDPALLAQLNAGGGVITIPGSGPKAPSGYISTGPSSVAPLTGGPNDPSAIAAEAAARARASAAASTPIEVAGQIQAAQARAAIETQAALQKAAQERAMGPAPTAESRDKALAKFNAGDRIQRLVDQIRQRYVEGPGATKGFSGLGDYLPTTANKRFDAAGQAVRGDVGAALGFTGGQLNSIAEAQMAVGPYIPEAGDRDEVILDKINRLQELANEARSSAAPLIGKEFSPASASAAPAALGAASGADLPPGSGGQGQSPIQPNGPTGPLNFDPSNLQSQANPLRSGVNAHVNEMLQRGAPDAEVQAYLASIGAPGAGDDTLAFRRNNPNYRGAYSVDLERQLVPMSAGQQALNAIGNSPVGAYFTNAADALTAGTLDNMTANPAQSRAIMSGIREQNPVSSTLGAISGGALAAGGLELGLGAAAARMGGSAAARLLASPITADAAYGAAYGAGSADEGGWLLGAGLGAGAGVGGGMFGRGLARGVGNATRGVRNDAVQYLRERGVPLTFGQTVGQSGTLGQVVKGFEDRLSGLPGVGSVVSQRYREGLEGLSQNAFDQALAPIGANTNGAIGEAGIDAARSARSQAYNNALGGVNVTRDPQFNADFTAAQTAGAGLPEPMRGNIDYTLNTRVENSFDPNGGLSGNGFQQAIRGLRRDERAVAQQPYGYDFGQITGQTEDALTGLLDRQAPGAVPAYQAANAANRNVEVLRSAVDRAKTNDGVFTPYQLAQLASQNARRFGNTQGTTNQPFYDLSRAAMQVLPNRVPDSGTAGRFATLALPTALAGGGAGAGALAGDTGEGAKVGLAAGLLAAAGGSRTGQRVLTSLVADRPDALIRIGDQIYNRARIGGMFGAGLGLGTYNALLPAQ